MPNLNGTGPNGQGPMTGGGFGNCTGYAQNASYGGRMGRGMRCGRGRGFGFRNAAPVNTTQSLEEEKKALEARLQAVSNQLSDAE